ncbi:MAG: AAA family ATPase [Proteobacteria bacterium]|nr:AAA family ATPase [Pseudomonadota bacterium]
MKDIILSFLWAVFFYFIASLIAKPLGGFIGSSFERELLLNTLLASIAILSAPSLASFFCRLAKTYKSMSYQSSMRVNIIVGLIFYLALTQYILKDKNVMFFNTLIFWFSIVSTLGIFVTLLLKNKSEKDTSKQTDNGDLLDRKEFIEKALYLLNNPKKLNSYSEDEALIIWIVSRWGAGKTWVMNQIRKQFIAKNKSRKVIWFSFNPWLQSSPNPEKALVEAFFNQLSDKINEVFLLEGLNSRIDDYTKSILSQGVGKSLGIDVNCFFNDSKTTEDFKNYISKFLMDNDIKLIITFDEIDRLTPKELVSCLKLIRSLANFSNTVILVCGASDKVEELLFNAKLPKDYFEKVAQVPLYLPVVRVNKILDILWGYIDGDRLDDENKKSLGSAISNLRMNISYGNDQTLLFNNLRIIERLADAIKIDFIGNGKVYNINSSDFVNLQLIRLNCLRLYEAVMDNKSMWIGEVSTEEQRRKNTKENLDAVVDEALSIFDTQKKKKEALKKILRQMFPVYKNESHEFIYTEVDKKNPIYEEDMFDRYFVESLPEGQISNKEIYKLVDDWGKNVDVKDSLDDFVKEDIVWIIRELVTTKPIELSEDVKKSLMKFIIDEKLDHNIEYEAHGFKLEPRDFSLSEANDYKDIIDYYFSKSSDVDDVFFDGVQYINLLYWREKRRGIDGVVSKNIDEWIELVREEFNSRFLDKGVDLLSLEHERLHYYWYILTRDNLEFDPILRGKIIDEIEGNAIEFCKYLYMYRESARNTKDGFRNNYRYDIVFTDENIKLAEKHLKSDNLEESDKADLADFIDLAKKIR